MIPAGTEIRCPRKNHKVGVFVRNLVPGAPLSVKDVQFEPGQERIAGEQMCCAVCGAAYVAGSLAGLKIFTNQGWLPDEPSLEPVKPNLGT